MESIPSKSATSSVRRGRRRQAASDTVHLRSSTGPLHCLQHSIYVLTRHQRLRCAVAVTHQEPSALITLQPGGAVAHGLPCLRAC